jgi:iron complex outermembrane receptor protein
MANRNVAAAVRYALIAASTAGAAVYAPSSVAVDEEIEQIVVTGSRIARPGVEEASPIAVVGNEEIALQGTQNIENVLFTLPQVVATQSSASNNPGGGVATVNLRGLGSQRTLVLVDGKRYISYDVNQVVDLNTVPTSLIERIDVVTGGRSAVYGSDAVAGVVNFVTKRNFEGAEFNGSYSTSKKGDADTYGFDMTVGGNFGEDDRGNAVLYGSYFNRSALLAGERDFTKVALSDAGDGTAFPGGSSGIPQLRLRVTGLNSALGFGGTDVLFNPDGTARQYDSQNDLYNFAPDNYLQVPQERYMVYGKAHFDVNDHFKPYVEGQFVNNRVDAQLAPTPVGNTTPGIADRGGLQVHVYSPFIDATTRAALQGLDTDGDGYVAGVNWGRRLTEVGPRVNLDDRSAYRLVAGAEGDVYGDWTYDASYMYARTRNSNGQQGNVAISRFLAGTRTAFMNAEGDVQAQPWNIAGLPNGGAGELVCADAAARGAGCVPINMYGQGNISGDAADYMRIGTINGEIAETKLASIVFQNGNLWDLGAGPMGLAAGFEHRTESGENQTDEFLAGGDVAGFNPSDPTKGHYTVSEYFAEVNVPVLRDAFLAHSLEFNGAYRFSDYSNEVGGVETWAAGGQWAPVRGFTVRGQYQRAIRGPSVAELFLGQTVSFDGGIDPCRLATAATDAVLRQRCIDSGVPAAAVGTPYGSGSTSYPATQGGNPDLHEETADTWTVGFVVQPAALPNFVATVDYFNIKIDDVISTVGAQNLITACFAEGVQSFCGQIHRDASGEFQSFDDFNVNAATLETVGVDVELGYNMDLGFGAFGGEGSNLAFRLNGTWTDKWDYTPVNGLDIINHCAGGFGRNCGAPLPEWGHSFRTTWSTGPFDASMMWRYIGSATDDDPETLYAREEFKAKSYFDFTFGWEFNEGLKLNLGIDNAFDEEPELGASTQQGGNVEQSNTYPTVYDVIGRYYWMTLNVKF